MDEALNVFIYLLFGPNSHNLGFGALFIFFAFSFKGFVVYADSLARPLYTAARRRRRREIERKERRVGGLGVLLNKVWVVELRDLISKDGQRRCCGFFCCR